MLKGRLSSSFEICFPVESPRGEQTSPMPTSKRTTNHAHAHHKAKVNRTRKQQPNNKQPHRNKPKTSTFTLKIFFCTRTNPTSTHQPTIQHTQTSRMPTLNVTHNNIERHAKTAKTEPKTPYRNQNSAQTANRKAQLQLQKIFSALILTLLQRLRTTQKYTN